MNVAGEAGTPSIAAPTARKKIPFRILLVLVYVWFFITTPHHRFEFLVSIRFERLLALLCLFVLVFSGSFRPRLTRISGLLLALNLLMLVSYAFCPYKNYVNVELWINEYWKVGVFFFLTAWNVTSVRDLRIFITGLVVIVFLNQLHSWFDFALGGNYVYQQGIKRIKSVWNGDGIGAPNQFALVALLVTPAIIFQLREATTRRSKLLFLSAMGLSLMTILFSGTRGALLGFVLVALANIVRARKLIRVGVVVGLAVILAFPFLPPELKHRYLSIFGLEARSGVVLARGAQEIQQQSQDARKEGLIDGYRLANRRPVLGYGPGSSAFARRLVTDNEKYKMWPLQTHNVYGQLLGDLGWSGALIVTSLAFAAWRLNRRSKTASIRAFFADMGIAILFYGLVTHCLYRWYVVFFLALFDGYAFIALLTPPGKEGVITDGETVNSR